VIVLAFIEIILPNRLLVRSSKPTFRSNMYQIVNNIATNRGVVNQAASITIVNTSSGSTTHVVAKPGASRKQLLDRGRWFPYHSLVADREPREWYKECTGDDFNRANLLCFVPLHPRADVFASLHGIVIVDLIEDGFDTSCTPPGSKSGDVVVNHLEPAVPWPNHYHRHTMVRRELELRMRRYLAEYCGLLGDLIERFGDRTIHLCVKNCQEFLGLAEKHGFLLNEVYADRTWTSGKWMFRPVD
jgi:hypothetical protein